MKFITGIFLVISLLTLSVSVSAQEKRPRYKSIYDIPRFIKYDHEENKTEFMQNIINSLQRSLIAAPGSVKFLDADGNVTRKSLEKYKKIAAKHVAKSQKRALVKWNENGDEYVTFSEFTQRGGYDEADVQALYDSVKKHGFDAVEKHEPILTKMKKTPSKKITILTFFEDIVGGFIELDKNADKRLSVQEISTPTKSALKLETEEIINIFEAYLALSDDGNKTTLEQIHEAAEKAYNTLDVNGNGRLDQSEYSLYLRARLPRSACNIVPNLNNENERLYAIAVSESNVATTLQFREEFGGGFTGYVDVEIEKQETPLNLILGSGNHMVWSLKGDIESLRNVIIFGPAKRKRFSNDNIDITKAYAGVIGVPEEKLIFVSKECWDFKLPNKHFPKSHNEEYFENARGLTKYLTGRYPHLLKTRIKASKVVIEKQPSIQFFDEIDDSLKKMPEGYNKDYWKEFLKWKTAGVKDLDINNIITRSKPYDYGMLPSWGGIAKLEHEGVLKPLNINIKKRKAVFLLQKDLPKFPGNQHSNPPKFTFISNNNSIKFPNAHNNRRASGTCIMSRDGDVLVGNQHTCTAHDLTYLKSENDSSEKSVSPVYLTLESKIPNRPKDLDSITIQFEIDEKRCKEEYGQAFSEKCVIPDDIIKKPLPVYALEMEPPLEGTLKWKDNQSLIFTSEHQEWMMGTRYTFVIDFENMRMPKGIYINNGRRAETQFMSYYDEKDELETRMVIANDIMGLFYLKDHRELERIAGEYRETQARSSSGKWKLILFYHAFNQITRRRLSEATWKDTFSFVDEWIKAYPDSDIPKVAKGLFLEDYAWHVIGGDGMSIAARDHAPEDVKSKFLDRMQKAHDYMTNIKSSSSDNPVWYFVMSGIMRGLYDDEAAYMALINEALDKHPGFYPIYFSALLYLSPHWRGNPEKIEKFAQEAVKRTKDKEGYALYARIYWYASQSAYGVGLFTQSDVVWDKMKLGIRDVLKEYPDQWNINNFAYFSCLVRDHAMTKELMSKMERPILRNGVWAERKFYEYCKAWAELAPKDAEKKK